MKDLIIGLVCLGCSQTSPELLAALEQNTAAVKKLSEGSSATSEPQKSQAPSQPEHIIVDYQTVRVFYSPGRHPSAEKLETKVKALMKEGWQPLGGHVFETKGLYNYYQQTMVKYGQPKEKEDKAP